MTIKHDIPRTMTLAGLNYLERIAASTPPDGTIIEIGAFYGSTSWVLAKSSDPSVSVHAVDTWKRVDWIINRFELERKAPNFSRRAFEEYTKDCDNLFIVEGKSPDILADWDGPVDMVFMDAVLGNPGFRDNLVFFEKLLQPGSVICGEGYAMRSHDVVREVDELAGRWRTRPEIIGRVWALRKPLEGQTKGPEVYEVATKPDGPLIRVTTDCQFMEPHQAPPLCWSGQLANPGSLRSFKLDWEERIDDLDIMYKCAGSHTKTSEPVLSGNMCMASSAKVPITSLFMKLVGKQANQYRLHFQAGFIKDGPAKFKDKANSKMHAGGKWLKSPGKNTPISALRVVVEKRS